MLCDGAEMKRIFPNSVEARQNFITKYNVVSISINNIFFVTDISVRPVLWHLQFWMELLVSGRNFRTWVLFRRLLFTFLPVNLVLQVLHSHTGYVLQQKSSNSYHTVHICFPSSDKREFLSYFLVNIPILRGRQSESRTKHLVCFQYLPNRDCNTY
jgi:hypothetical protein